MVPILYSTPWFNVYSYGLMVALGYSAATAWIVWLASKEGLPGETIFDMLLIQLVVGIIGSRFFYVLEMGNLLGDQFSFWKFEQGGLTFYGCVVTSLIFDFLFLKFYRLPYWHVMDCVGNGLPLGIAIARVGCFLNGCCHGVPCQWPWGVVFPRVASIPLHPTQLYESIGALVIFFLLQKIWKWRRNYGQGLIASLVFYAVFRFFVEFWRGDNSEYFLGMTFSQIVSLSLIVGGYIAWKAIERVPALRILPVTTKA